MLEDDQSLSSIGVSPGDTLLIVLRLRGNWGVAAEGKAGFGDLFVKTLTGKTILLSDVDLENTTIEDKEGIAPLPALDFCWETAGGRSHARQLQHSIRLHSPSGSPIAKYGW